MTGAKPGYKKVGAEMPGSEQLRTYRRPAQPSCDAGNLENFGLHAGNMKFNTQNEE
jgi:hypothetical protein